MNQADVNDSLPLHARTLTSIADAIAAGDLDSEAVTAHMLARIAERDSDYRAYQLVLADDALATARALDQRRARGEPLGPLHGVPVAIKDLLDLTGTPNTMGSPVYADVVSTADAEVVRRLKAAGAVILGKLKLTEGAFSQHHPSVAPPLNPWDASRWAGVSSSGSGVACAAQLCFGAIGTDTGGSIRFPSAACGLVGLKPTYGRVSRRGAFPLGESLDHIGPMTRSVMDAARMFAALAGHDPLDSNSVDVPVQDYPGACGADARGLRIGMDRRCISAGVDADVVATAEAAAEALAAAGAEVVELELPDARALVEGWAITCSVEAAMAHAEAFPARRGEFGPVLAALLDLGHRCTGIQYATLERAREHYGRALDQVLTQVDAILLPAMPMAPPLITDMDAPTPSDVADPITFTAPCDYSGHPSLTLPAGLDAAGLPRSFQLIGNRFDEARLLTLGAAYERQRGVMPAPPNL